MLNISEKYFILLVLGLLLLLPGMTFANVADSISIDGPINVAVGKSNVVYSVDYYCSRDITSSSFVIKDGNTVLVSGTVDDVLTVEKMPTSQKELRAEATINYTGQPSGESGVLSAAKTIKVRKPIMSARRQTIENSYYSADSEVPIHWNKDDDDESGFEYANFIDFGYDYLQSSMSDSDDDLLSVEAWIKNTELDTSGCNLKIEVPNGLKLWRSTLKSTGTIFSNGGEIVEIDDCDITNWLNANTRNNNMFVEWIKPLNAGVSLKINFYCNDIKFAEFEYHGYAVTAVSDPFPSERHYYETSYLLRGCQWGVIDHNNINNYDSVAYAVDPSWEVYLTPFVVTGCDPLCPNIYTLVSHNYMSFTRDCMSMDTFGDQDRHFDIFDDASDFFENSVWPDNFIQVSNNTSFKFCYLLYYNYNTLPFAATKDTTRRAHCFGNWVMFDSHFFNKQRIMHRPLQLGLTVLQKYVIDPE